MKLGLLSLGLFMLMAQSGVASPAHLTESQFDFGKTPAGTTIYYRTWLISDSEDTVGVGDLKSGCGCITLESVEHRLLPRDSLPLSLNWQTRQPAGQIEQVVYLFLHGDDQPMQVRLTAEILIPGDTSFPLVVSPLTQSARRRLPKGTQGYTLGNKTPIDWALRMVSRLDNRFTVDFPDTLGGGLAGAVRMKRTGDNIGDQLERSVTLEFKGEDGKTERLTVGAQWGDFSFRPIGTTIDRE